MLKVKLFPDIANRWQAQEANNPGLPKNVVLNLRKVMNKEGRLSFERFCAGLKISILRHEAERNKVEKRHKVRECMYRAALKDSSQVACHWMNKLCFLPTISRRAQFFHPIFPQPGKSLLVQPCRLFAYQL